MMLVIHDCMIENEKTRQIKIQCYYRWIPRAAQLEDFMPNGDFFEAILNAFFDWNGSRKPYTVTADFTEHRI